MDVIRCARLPLPVALDAFRSELAAISQPWHRHFQAAHFDGDWSAVALRSPGGSSDALVPEAFGAQLFQPTPLWSECPEMARFVSSLDCTVRSARLLRLGPGSVIKEHRDSELAFEQGDVRLHVPITTSPEVEFVIDGHRVVMEAGSCWYVNANLLHRVANHGPTDRVHLVVDCEVNDWIRDLFERGEVLRSSVRRDPAELREMIRSFREMGTPTALRLAAELEQELTAP